MFCVGGISAKVLTYGWPNFETASKMLTVLEDLEAFEAQLGDLASMVDLDGESEDEVA